MYRGSNLPEEFLKRVHGEMGRSVAVTWHEATFYDCDGQLFVSAASYRVVAGRGALLVAVVEIQVQEPCTALYNRRYSK